MTEWGTAKEDVVHVASNEGSARAIADAFGYKLFVREDGGEWERVL